MNQTKALRFCEAPFNVKMQRNVTDPVYMAMIGFVFSGVNGDGPHGPVP